MRLIRTSAWCEIVEARDRDAIYTYLDKPFSYPVEGAIYSELYRTHRWDGRVHLLKRTRAPGISFPGGLFVEIEKMLAEAGYAFDVDDRRIEAPAMSTRPEWVGPPLRDYQSTAVTLAVVAGRGILKLPIRSGKTLTAAAMIQELGVRALFVVTSDLLLRQAERAMKGALAGITVTTIGAGSWDDTGDVVIASIQTLQARLKTRAFARLARSFGVAFFDEVHHLQGKGDSWRDAALAINAFHKYGLSATVESDPTADCESGDAWLRGIVGPVIYEVSMADLMRVGHLVRATVRFVRHAAPPIKRRWSPIVHDEAIVDSPDRNGRIADVGARYALDGWRVLVDVGRVRHARLLYKALSDRLPPGRVAVLLGSTKAATREQVIDAYSRGDVWVVVSTILGEGIDIPAIEVVINAEGGRAKVAVEQRMRNLTPAPGKRGAVVIELVDTHHPQLAGWTGERLAIYKAKNAFDLVVDPMVDTRPT